LPFFFLDKFFIYNEPDSDPIVLILPGANPRSILSSIPCLFLVIEALTQIKNYPTYLPSEKGGGGDSGANT